MCSIDNNLERGELAATCGPDLGREGHCRGMLSGMAEPSTAAFWCWGSRSFHMELVAVRRTARSRVAVAGCLMLQLSRT